MIWTATDFMTNQHNYTNTERLACEVNLDFTLVVFFTGHNLLEPQRGRWKLSSLGCTHFLKIRSCYVTKPGFRLAVWPRLCWTFGKRTSAFSGLWVCTGIPVIWLGCILPWRFQWLGRPSPSITPQFHFGALLRSLIFPRMESTISHLLFLHWWHC